MKTLACAIALLALSALSADDPNDLVELKCSDSNPNHTWLIVPSMLSTVFGQQTVTTGWQHGGESYRAARTRTGIFVVPTAAPRHWLLRQHGGPDIHVRFEEGAFADPTVDACMVDTLGAAVSGIPAVVGRSLPANTHIVAERVNEVGTWTAAHYPDSGEYRVSVHPEHLNYGCIDSNGNECCRPGEPYGTRGLRGYHGFTSHFEEVLIHEFAHVIDLRFNVTHGEEHGDWWREVQETGREHSGSFVSSHASTNRMENFAETFTAWLAYHSGRLAPWHDPDSDDHYKHIRAKMCREMKWWDGQFARAAASPNGALWLRSTDWYSPSWKLGSGNSGPTAIADSFPVGTKSN